MMGFSKKKKHIKNWLVYKIGDKFLRNLLPKYVKGKLVDIGCGEKPYADVIKSYVAEHIGVDHQDTLRDKCNIDRFGTAYDIPAEDGEFDSAICTAVMEHLEETDKAIKEADRVLKKGGYAIYTVPLFWHLHEEPRDFYRYTKYGLKYLFEKNGFEIAKLRALPDCWVTFGREFVYYSWRFPTSGALSPLRWMIPPMGILIQGMSHVFRQD